MSYDASTYFAETNPTKSRVLGLFTRHGSNGIKEFLLGLHTKQGKYNGVGGRIGDSPEFENETPVEALAREVYEELNSKVLSAVKRAEITYTFLRSDGAKATELGHFYVINSWLGEPAESEALTNLIWVTLDQFPWDKMWPNDQIWMKPLLSGKQFLNAEFLIQEAEPDAINNFQLKWTNLPS